MGVKEAPLDQCERCDYVRGSGPGLHCVFGKGKYNGDKILNGTSETEVSEVVEKAPLVMSCLYFVPKIA